MWDDGGKVAAEAGLLMFGLEFASDTPRSGATFRARFPRHEPRVETLGYSLKPFHGSTHFPNFVSFVSLWVNFSVNQSADFQILNAEQSRCVGPEPFDGPSRTDRKFSKLPRGVFI
jgi:hypothetical protein